MPQFVVFLILIKSLFYLLQMYNIYTDCYCGPN